MKFMNSKKIYIVASTENLRDVHIEEVYDGTVFTVDTIVEGYKKKLKGLNYQIAILGDNAFIDLIDANHELVKTYSIISKVAMLTK